MDLSKIYQQIAQKHGVSVEEVQAEMQKAIDAAWMEGDRTEAVRTKQQEVASTREVPTPEELIYHIVGRFND